MSAEDVGRLDVGGRIELDVPPGEQALLYAGARRIARGEPALMDGKFCLRVSAVIDGPGRYVPDFAGDASDGQKQ